MKYKVHPVAELFPMLTPGSRAYNDLEENIRIYGQVEPIMLDGDVLLDGRNRLAICEALGIEPKVVQWSTIKHKVPDEDKRELDDLEPHEWIFVKNNARRNLTEDQRLAIYVAYNAWDMEHMAAAQRRQAQFKPGNPDGRAGRKPKEMVNPKSGSPLKRDTKKMKAASTAGKVAAATGASQYKAEEVVALYKRAEAGDEQASKAFEDIKVGMTTVREIAKKKREAKPMRPRKAPPLEAEKVGDSGDVAERMARRPRRGFGITYSNLLGVLGKVDVNWNRICVQLNEDHPFIQRTLDEKNTNCLMACAALLLCNQQAENTEKGQILMSFEGVTQSEKFVEMVSKVFDALATNREGGTQ